MSQGNDSDRPDDNEAGSSQVDSGGAGEPAAEPGAGQSPDDELKRQEQELERAKREQQSAAARVQETESRIAELKDQKQALDGLDKIVGDYAKEYKKLKDSERKCEDFGRHQEVCLKGILGEAADEVERIVERIRKDREDLQAEVDDDRRALEGAKEHRADAEQRREEAKAQLDRVKNTIAGLRDKLNALEALSRDIKSAHDSGEYAWAYWLLTKLAGRLGGEPHILSQEELGRALRDAWWRHYKATSRFHQQDAQVKSADKALEAKKERLAELDKKLDATIRAELAKVEPKMQQAS